MGPGRDGVGKSTPTPSSSGGPSKGTCHKDDTFLGTSKGIDPLYVTYLVEDLPLYPRSPLDEGTDIYFT